MLFPISTSDLVPDQEGVDKDTSSSLPPALANKEEKKEGSTVRLQTRRQVCTPIHKLLYAFPWFSWFCNICLFFFSKGNKRRAVEVSSDLPVSSSPRPSGKRSEGRSLPLKARYGINAWKRWALAPHEEAEDSKGEDISEQNKGKELRLGRLLICRFKTLWTDNNSCCRSPTARSKSSLLSLSPEELNASLSQFVKEVCRPNGERYSPDSILYLCLGIQQVGNKSRGCLSHPINRYILKC